MDKYLLLFLLNLPFVVFGLLKAVMSYRTKQLNRNTLIIRIIFWLIILAGLIFAEYIYEYLFQSGLTDSTPLSIPDVILTTGVMTCLFLSIRLFSKVDGIEKRLTDLHEKISVLTSLEK